MTNSIAVTWAGAGEPITLTVHGETGAVAVPLLPKRALESAKELVEPPANNGQPLLKPG